MPLFAPLPEEEAAVVDVKLSDIEGLRPATVAVLEEAGYKTLNDIIDLEREDFLRLAGIAPEEADRIMAFIDEVTEEGGSDSPEGGAAPEDGKGSVNAERREQKLLGLVGLGVRGRGAVIGVEQVRDGGAARHARTRDRGAGRRREQPEEGAAAPGGEEDLRSWRDRVPRRLGAAVGRESAAAVGIVDRNLARGIRGRGGNGLSRAPREDGLIKLRVHDLAGEFGISNDELISMLRSIDVAGPQSSDAAHRRPGRALARALGAREARPSGEAGRRAGAPSPWRGCRRRDRGRQEAGGREEIGRQEWKAFEEGARTAARARCAGGRGGQAPPSHEGGHRSRTPPLPRRPPRRPRSPPQRRPRPHRSSRRPCASSRSRPSA